MSISRKSSLPLAILALALPSALVAQTAVTVSVNHDTPRATAIPSDFEGYSFEVVAADASQYPNNVNWFSESQTALINLMRTVGVKTLRFGGSTMEEDGVDPYPTNADGAAVNDFANAIGANLIWGVPVGNDKYNLTTYTAYAKALIDDKDSKSIPLTQYSRLATNRMP
jgi:hypothetical protein